MILLDRPDLDAILNQLHATRATPKERQRKLEKTIRDEARRLKGSNRKVSSSAGVADRDNKHAESGWFKEQCKLLDLDSLAKQGSLSSDHKCTLPAGSYRRYIWKWL